MRASGEDARQSIFKDTGVFPLIARSLLSFNILDRIAARGLLALTRVLPSLRSNLGALATLLGLGLASIILIAVFAIWRPSSVTARSRDGSGGRSARRQIHRQMYRLQASRRLPTEGVGPVISLWTREVKMTSATATLMADLEATPMLQVLAGGLLIIAAPWFRRC